MSVDYQTATHLMQLLEHVDAGHPLRPAEIRGRFEVDDACAGRYDHLVPSSHPAAPSTPSPRGASFRALPCAAVDCGSDGRHYEELGRAVRGRREENRFDV